MTPKLEDVLSSVTWLGQTAEMRMLVAKRTSDCNLKTAVIFDLERDSMYKTGLSIYTPCTYSYPIALAPFNTKEEHVVPLWRLFHYARIRDVSGVIACCCSRTGLGFLFWCSLARSAP